MPDGKTHAKMTVTAACVLAIAMWRTGFTFEEIRTTVQGCLTGLVLSPDLDVDGGFIGHTWMRKYFGEIVGRIWRYFWWPYAIIFSHRSNGSHIPVLSTAGRVLYLYGTYFVVCKLFQVHAWVPELHTALYMFGGLVVVDTLHYIADIISTAIKRRRYANLPVSVRRMQDRRRTYTRLQREASQKTQRVRR